MRVENIEVFRTEKPDGWINIVTENKSIYTDSFSTPYEAQHHYFNEQENIRNTMRIEELKQGLLLLGGFIGGIGLSAISKSDGLSIYSSNTYLGLGLITASGVMAKVGYEAFDKYERAKELLEKGLKRLKFLSEVNNEILKEQDLIVAAPPPPLNFENISEVDNQQIKSESTEKRELFGDDWTPKTPNFKRVEFENSKLANNDDVKSENISVENTNTTSTSVDKLQRKTRKPRVRKINKENTNERLIGEVNDGDKVKVQLSEVDVVINDNPISEDASQLKLEPLIKEDANSEKDLRVIVSGKNKSQPETGYILQSKPKEVIYNENIYIQEILKHNLWREEVIKRERKFLKKAGIIPKHNCFDRECEVCAQYDPIFL